MMGPFWKIMIIGSTMPEMPDSRGDLAELEVRTEDKSHPGLSWVKAYTLILSPREKE